MRYRSALCCIGICLSLNCFGQTTVSLPSASSIDAVHVALTMHKAGNTTAAISSLENYLKTAAPVDAIRPIRQLAYLYIADHNKTAAKNRFLRLAKLKPGMADDVRGEAALRMAYLSKGRDRAIWAERIVAGDFTVTDEQLYQAYRLAAGVAHSRDDLRRAVELYQQTPEIETAGSGRAYVFKELAGLYFEVAKGEGDTPIVESMRPQMFAQARDICNELIAIETAPKLDRMVAQLMESETWFFEGDYETSYQHATAFFEKYGMYPSKYKDSVARQYINAARALQMQNCYFTGRHDEAQSLAQHTLEHRPKSKNEFQSSDSTLIAFEVMKLCGLERGDNESVTLYSNQAWQYRSDYLGTEKMMQQRRANWLARAGK